MPAQKTLFLERRKYRARRVADAIIMLPLLGWGLFTMPILWSEEAEPARTSSTGLYLFSVWGGLVLALLILTRLRQSHAIIDVSDAVEETDVSPLDPDWDELK